MERIRRRAIDGSARKGADETGPEENRKDAKVLGGVVNSDTLVARSKGVLDQRAEVVWQWHVLGRCANACDDNRVWGYQTEVVTRREECPDHEDMEGYRRSAHG